MYDLRPVAGSLAALLPGVTDLSLPTPCPAYSLGDLVEHVGGLALAFTAAARKDPLEGNPSGDASRLPEDWRTLFPERLSTLALAWRSPEAWTGMTRVGGVDLPGAVAGRVALNELVVHGWDIARASGQPWEPDEESVAGALEFVSQVPATGPQRDGGLFGPAVPVPREAPPLVHLIALTGRDPSWPTS